MCRCGLDFKGVINVFPSLPREEIAAIYKFVISHGSLFSFMVSLMMASRLTFLTAPLLNTVSGGTCSNVNLAGEITEEEYNLYLREFLLRIEILLHMQIFHVQGGRL